MPQEMLTGKAIGGPRAGVKLIASSRWDGKIRKPTKVREDMRPESAHTLFHQGHYSWRPVSVPNGFYKTWVWLPHKVASRHGHSV